jgi:hypothetical protein
MIYLSTMNSPEKKNPPNTAPLCGIFDVHPIPDKVRRGHGGTAARKDGVRVFEQFAWLGVGSVKAALPRPTHLVVDWRSRVEPHLRVPLSPGGDLRQGATQSPEGDDVARR